MSRDLFSAAREARDRTKPTPSVYPGGPKTLAEAVRQGEADNDNQRHPSSSGKTPACGAEDAGSIPAGRPTRLLPPLLFAGGGTCAQCAKRYIDHYFDCDRFVAENIRQFRTRPGYTLADVTAEQRRRHKALLLQRGAEECQFRCGWALVAPPHAPEVAGNYRELSERQPGEDEDDGEPEEC